MFKLITEQKNTTVRLTGKTTKSPENFEQTIVFFFSEKITGRFLGVVNLYRLLQFNRNHVRVFT